MRVEGLCVATLPAWPHCHWCLCSPHPAASSLLAALAPPRLHMLPLRRPPLPAQACTSRQPAMQLLALQLLTALAHTSVLNCTSIAAAGEAEAAAEAAQCINVAWLEPAHMHVRSTTYFCSASRPPHSKLPTAGASHTLPAMPADTVAGGGQRLAHLASEFSTGVDADGLQVGSRGSNGKMA